MSKAELFLEHLINSLKNPYLWGAQGESMLDAITNYIRIKEEGSATNTNRVLAYIKATYPSLYTELSSINFTDCSGLGVEHFLKMRYIKSDMTADGLYNRCRKVTRSELRPCDGVFRKSGEKMVHVGYVYSVSGDNVTVIHAKGRETGVVRESINESRWTDYGRFPWFEDAYVTISRNLRMKMTGEDVKAVQEALISKDFPCGKSGADGEYGSKTVDAVRAFQVSQELTADGVCGKQTVNALGLLWGGRR